MKAEKHRLADFASKQFEKELEKSRSKTGKVNMFKAVFRMFKADIGLNAFYAIISEILNLINLFCLRYFFGWIANPDHVNWHGYAYAVLMGTLSIIAQLFKNHSLE